jgi:lipopolysaccharide/colanic/teichoic acid biosynthesis glycosyltransferase
MKFRTMEAVGGAGAAEETKAPLYRLTGVGRLLRRTRLAEIPQFLNVLKGDLSLVGPRPEPTAAAVRLRDAIPPYALRFLVKPGLMGWAQVQHRFGIAVEESLERLKFDLYYIKNMSFRLDLFVILKTLKLVAFPGVR